MSTEYTGAIGRGSNVTTAPPDGVSQGQGSETLPAALFFQRISGGLYPAAFLPVTSDL